MVARLQVWCDTTPDGAQHFTYVVPAQPGQPLQRYQKTRTQALREELTRDLLDTADRLQAWRPDGRLDPAAGEFSFEQLGAALAQRFLPSAVRDFLFASRDPLLIDTDDPTFPWELLTVSGVTLGVHRPVARMTPLSHRPIRAARLWGATRKALVICDPQHDLPSATNELRALTTRLEGYRAPYAVAPLAGGEATTTRLHLALQAGYEVLHFIGHAEYDELDHGASALVCADGGRCDAEMIRGAQGDYAFVFINGCQSAQAAQTTSPDAYLMSSGGPRVEGLAQAFIDGGARAFVGALWPVLDDGAHRFAEAFYAQVTAGATFGEALQRVRAVWRAQYPHDPTWAAYVLYGEPTLTLDTVREPPYSDAASASHSAGAALTPVFLADPDPLAYGRVRAGAGEGAPDDTKPTPAAPDQGAPPPTEGGLPTFGEQAPSHAQHAGHAQYADTDEQADEERFFSDINPDESGANAHWPASPFGAGAGLGAAGGGRPMPPAPPQRPRHSDDDTGGLDGALRHYLLVRIGEPPLTIAPEVVPAFRNAIAWCYRMSWSTIARFDLLLGLAQLQSGALQRALATLGSTVAAVETANVQLFKQGPGVTGGLGFSHGISLAVRDAATSVRALGRTTLTDRDIVLQLLAPPVDGSVLKGFDYLPFTPEALLAALNQPPPDAIATPSASANSPRQDGQRQQELPPGAENDPVKRPPAGSAAESKNDASILRVFRDLRAEARQRLEANACPPLVDRTAQLNAMVFHLTDPTSGRVVLRGLPGVGKQAFIDQLARQLEEEPDGAGVGSLAGWGFYAVRIAPTTEGPGEWLATHLHELRAQGPAIVVFEDFLAALRLPGIPAVLRAALEEDSDLRFLVMTTFTGYEAALATEPELVAQFAPIDLLPPITQAQAYHMVDAYARFLERQLPVRIEPAAIQRAIQLAPALAPLALPGAANERLEAVCAVAVSARAAELGAPDDAADAIEAAAVTLNEAPPLAITAQMVEQTPYASERS